MPSEGSTIILASIIILLAQPSFSARPQLAIQKSTNNLAVMKSVHTISRGADIFGKIGGVAKPSPEQLSAMGTEGGFSSIAQLADTRKETSDPQERVGTTLLRLNIQQGQESFTQAQSRPVRVVRKSINSRLKAYEALPKKDPYRKSDEGKADYTFDLGDTSIFDLFNPDGRRALSRTEGSPEQIDQSVEQAEVTDHSSQLGQTELQQPTDKSTEVVSDWGDIDWMQGDDYSGDFEQGEDDLRDPSNKAKPTLKKNPNVNLPEIRPKFGAKPAEVKPEVKPVLKKPLLAKPKAMEAEDKPKEIKKMLPLTKVAEPTKLKATTKDFEKNSVDETKVVAKPLIKKPIENAQKVVENKGKSIGGTTSVGKLASSAVKGSVEPPREIKQVVKISSEVEDSPALKNKLVVPAKLEPMYPEAKLERLPSDLLKEQEEGEEKDLVPISIKWEMGAADRFFKEFVLDQDYYTPLKTAIEEATSIIRMYLKVPTSAERTVEMPVGNYCQYNFEKAATHDAHLVMVVHIYDPNKKGASKAIAQANRCDISNKRSQRGRIGFNYQKLIAATATVTDKEDFLNTIVHETFHAIAFNLNWENMLRIPKLPSRFALLNEILMPAVKSNTKIFDKGHWLETYVPNDVMIPISRANLIWTALSMEIIEMRSPEYSADRTLLPQNPALDDMAKKEELVTYKCGDDDPVSKLGFFCSKREANEDKFGCSHDYTFVAECSTKKLLSNNCYPYVAIDYQNCQDVIREGKAQVQEFEHRGEDARCFEGNFKSGKDRTSFCLKYEVEEEVVKVVVQNRKYSCRRTGQIIEVDFKSGEDIDVIDIRCPDIQRFLSLHRRTKCPNSCHKHGYCSSGKCICFEGWDQATDCRTPSERTTIHNIFTYSKVEFVGPSEGSPDDSAERQVAKL